MVQHPCRQGGLWQGQIPPGSRGSDNVRAQHVQYRPGSPPFQDPADQFCHVRRAVPSSVDSKLTSPALVLSRFCHVQLFATPWTVARQVPLATGLSWQEYWRGLPFPAPGDLPDPGILVSHIAGRFVMGLSYQGSLV